MSDTIFEPFSKQETFNDTMVTMILFNATMTSATAIKDTDYKHRAKSWLQNWYKTGTNLWKEVKRNSQDVPMAIDTYEEIAAYILEVTQIALNHPDYNTFLKQIQQCK